MYTAERFTSNKFQVMDGLVAFAAVSEAPTQREVLGWIHETYPTANTKLFVVGRCLNSFVERSMAVVAQAPRAISYRAYDRAGPYEKVSQVHTYFPTYKGVTDYDSDLRTRWSEIEKIADQELCDGCEFLEERERRIEAIRAIITDL